MNYPTDEMSVSEFPSALAEELLTRVHDESRQGSAKVTVVGSGQVGMAAAFAMMTQVDLVIHYFLFCNFVKSTERFSVFRKQKFCMKLVSWSDVNVIVVVNLYSAES